MMKKPWVKLTHQTCCLKNVGVWSRWMMHPGDAIYWRCASSGGDIFEEDIWLIKMKTFDCSILLGNLFVAKEELFESQCYETLHRRVKHLCNRHLKRRSDRAAVVDFETGIEKKLTHQTCCLKNVGVWSNWLMQTGDAIYWRCDLLKMSFKWWRHFWRRHLADKDEDFCLFHPVK